MNDLRLTEREIYLMGIAYHHGTWHDPQTPADAKDALQRWLRLPLDDNEILGNIIADLAPKETP